MENKTENREKLKLTLTAVLSAALVPAGWIYIFYFIDVFSEPWDKMMLVLFSWFFVSYIILDAMIDEINGLQHLRKYVHPLKSIPKRIWNVVYVLIVVEVIFIIIEPILQKNKLSMADGISILTFLSLLVLITLVSLFLSLRFAFHMVFTKLLMLVWVEFQITYKLILSDDGPLFLLLISLLIAFAIWDIRKDVVEQYNKLKIRI